MAGNLQGTVKRRVLLVLTNQKTGAHKDITDLRVAFSMKKSHKTLQNRATIKIYNMSPDGRKFIREARDHAGEFHIHVTLFAWHVQGENSDTPIFTGLCETTSELIKPNWITTLQGLDSTDSFRNFSYERKHVKGTSVRTIINSLARESGVPVRVIGKIQGSLLRDRTFSGAPINILNDFRNTYGFTFEVLDSTLVVRVPRPDAFDYVEIHSGTGMIGTPRLRSGVLDVRVLITPTLLPDTFIRVTSIQEPSLNGIYIIRKINTRGDTWSGDWTTNIEAVILGTPSVFYVKEYLDLRRGKGVTIRDIS